ncbi:hypothetical protein LTR99_004248, partial [Exophiala xenobiotica]
MLPQQAIDAAYALHSYLQTDIARQQKLLVTPTLRQRIDHVIRNYRRTDTPQPSDKEKETYNAKRAKARLPPYPPNWLVDSYSAKEALKRLSKDLQEIPLEIPEDLSTSSPLTPLPPSTPERQPTSRTTTHPPVEDPNLTSHSLSRYAVQVPGNWPTSSRNQAGPSHLESHQWETQSEPEEPGAPRSKRTRPVTPGQ